jgi:pilus assembly protein Flp/PilA
MRQCIPEQDEWSRERIPKMKSFATVMLRFIRAEKGTTSIEYALVASLIFLAIVLSVTQLGASVTRFYQLIASCVPK